MKDNRIHPDAPCGAKLGSFSYIVYFSECADRDSDRRESRAMMGLELEATCVTGRCSMATEFRKHKVDRAGKRRWQDALRDVRVKARRYKSEDHPHTECRFVYFPYRTKSFAYTQAETNMPGREGTLQSPCQVAGSCVNVHVRTWNGSSPSDANWL
jgi:hypothetical protein